MSHPNPPDVKESIRDLDERTAKLKAYLASTPAFTPDPSSQSGLPESLWNILSILSPFLGFVIAVFVGAGSAPGGWGYGKVFGFGVTFLICIVLGTIAGVVAQRRNEERPGLTQAALILNLSILCSILALLS